LSRYAAFAFPDPGIQPHYLFGLSLAAHDRSHVSAVLLLSHSCVLSLSCKQGVRRREQIETSLPVNSDTKPLVQISIKTQKAGLVGVRTRSWVLVLLEDVQNGLCRRKTCRAVSWEDATLRFRHRSFVQADIPCLKGTRQCGVALYSLHWFFFVIIDFLIYA
jgi:hypothetical protein